MWFYIQGILTLAMINTIAVVGLSVFTGFTGLFSLGQAGFIAIGAYTAAILTYFYHINYYLAIIVGSLAAGLVSLIIGIPTLRAKLRSDYFAIATMGFGEATRLTMENLPITQGARGLPGIVGYTNFINVIIIFILVVFITRNFVYSKYGRRAIAIREDYIAAEMMGINLFRVRLLSLFYSACCAGLTGGLFAHYVQYIQPSMFTAAQSTILTASVVAGGMGSITGPILASLFFAAIPEVFRVANMWRLVAYGALLVAIMVFRPQGLLGYKEFSLSGSIKSIKSIINKVKKKPSSDMKGGLQ